MAPSEMMHSSLAVADAVEDQVVVVVDPLVTPIGDAFEEPSLAPIGDTIVVEDQVVVVVDPLNAVENPDYSEDIYAIQQMRIELTQLEQKWEANFADLENRMTNIEIQMQQQNTSINLLSDRVEELANLCNYVYQIAVTAFAFVMPWFGSRKLYSAKKF